MALTKVTGSGIGTVTDNVVITSDDPTITMTDSSGTNDITTIQSTSGALIFTARDGSADGEIIFKKFDGTTTDESMRITSGGNLLLRSEATCKIEMGSDGTSGTNSCNFIRGNNDTIDLNTGGGNYTFEVNGAVKVQFDTNGTVRNSTGTYTTISDQTLKENIVDANSQWDDIKALRIRNFNFIGDDLTQLGVIAQEVESAGMNGLVEDIIWDGEEVKSVKQSIIYMKAVKAIQEAITRIETLETANTALEARITALENA